ncbi:MAG: hypothetical protein DRJ40_01845 [Thermoprotei archaeon]|nr:MAG: hypothetical protein DRJ40_01845 [Thermoprotei archaeon]
MVSASLSERERVLWSRYTWCELKSLIPELAAVIIPTGSIEQHGPHLPLDTDAYIAEELAIRVAMECWKKGLKVLVVPTVVIGCSSHFLPYPGTLTLSFDTFMKLLEEVCTSVIHHGVKRILLLNAHGGNTECLHLVARKLRERFDVVIAVVNWWDLARDIIEEVCESPMYHACEVETSLALALSQRVIMELARGELKKPKSRFESTDLTKPGMVYVYRGRGRKELSTGAVGLPEKATYDKGSKILSTLVTRLVEVIEDLVKLG